MNMDSGPPPINRIWQAVQDHEKTVAAYTERGNDWVNENLPIKERLRLLTANLQADDSTEALINYIKSEAHPAALYTLWMVKGVTVDTGLPLGPMLQFVRSIFAAGYVQALRDATEEEIIV